VATRRFPLLRSVALVSPLLRFVLERALPRIRRGELDMALSLLPEIPVESLQVMDRPTRLGASWFR